MVLPVVALLLTTVVVVGQVAAGHLATQHLATVAAQTAAVADDAAVMRMLARAGVDAVQIDPPTRRPGDPVTVTVRRRLVLPGILDGLTVVARAMALTQDAPPIQESPPPRGTGAAAAGSPR